MNEGAQKQHQKYWEVIAKPSGELQDLNSKTELRYLFYETKRKEPYPLKVCVNQKS